MAPVGFAHHIRGRLENNAIQSSVEEKRRYQRLVSVFHVHLVKFQLHLNVLLSMRCKYVDQIRYHINKVHARTVQDIPELNQNKLFAHLTIAKSTRDFK